MCPLKAIEIKAFVPAKNSIMYLLVPDVKAWFERVRTQDLAGRYGAQVTPLVNQPWGINEFVLIDPAGVCWHIGQNTPGFAPVGRLAD